MQNSQYAHNNTEYIKTEEFQLCAGKDCNKQGTNSLKIIYINKTGFFCDSCKQDLLALKLVIES